MNQTLEPFSTSQIDALKEIINIGTGHAATALSKLINKTVRVNVPEIKVVEISKIPQILGGAELLITGLYFKISGNLSGSILLFFPQDTADLLTEFLTSNITLNASEFNEIKKSAIMELGNILTNSYLNAMAEIMDMKILLSVPFYSSDSLSAVIDFLLIEISEVSDYALLMETVITSSEINITGNIMIFPDIESFEKIFQKIGLK